MCIWKGVKTLRTQDTSDPRHFGTIRLVPKCPDSSALVPKCLSDTSALVPNCLDLKHTYLVYLNLYVHNIAHLIYCCFLASVCSIFGYFLHESEMIYICALQAMLRRRSGRRRCTSPTCWHLSPVCRHWALNAQPPMATTPSSCLELHERMSACLDEVQSINQSSIILL